MLIEDFIVKKKTVSGLHRDACEDCKRVENLYRTVPGFKSNIVFYVAKPCLSILKKKRRIFSDDEVKATKEFTDFLKESGDLSVATGTAERGKEKEKIFILSKGKVIKK